MPQPVAKRKYESARVVCVERIKVNRGPDLKHNTASEMSAVLRLGWALMGIKGEPRVDRSMVRVIRKSAK
jgi:hypothetical protein